MGIDRGDVLRLRIDVEGKKAAQELDKFRAKAKRTATDTGQSFKKASAGVSAFRNQFLGITVVAGAVAGAFKAVDAALVEAQRITSVSAAFATLTRRMGESSSVMLDAMRPAAQGLISDMDLMLQTNNAILLGLPATSTQMAELTEASLLLGRAMGIDATSGLNSMILGIGRQSRMLLDNLGITVSVEEANRKYADALGVNVSELDDAQRKQAFFNETLEKSRAAVDGLASSTLTLADVWKQHKIDVQNVKNAYLDLINRGAIPLAKILTEGANQGGAGPRMLGLAAQLAMKGMAPEDILAVLLGVAAGPQGGGAQPLGEVGAPAGGPVAEPATSVGAGGELSTPMLLAGPSSMFSDATLDSIVNVRAESQALLNDYMTLTDAIMTGTLTTEQQEMAYELLKQKAIELRELGIDPLSGAFEAQGDTVLATAAKWSTFGQMAAQAAGRLFQENKKVQYATAIISTAAAVVQALAHPPGPPTTIPMAIATAAMGAVQLATIAKTRPGTAGGVSMPGSGGGGVQTGSAAGPGPVQVHVFIDGQGFVQDLDSFSRDLGLGIQQQLDRAGVTHFGES